MTSRTRTTAVLAAALCWAVAGCGDNSNLSETNGRQVTPGFFIGETHNGEDLSIAVGSIRAVFFRCSGLIVSERFDPPEPVAADGSFAVEVHAPGGGTFVVSGELVSNDRIEGAIAGTAACDGSFVARRCDPSTQACGDRDGDLIPDQVDPDTSTSPTPARTPSPVHTGGTTATAASSSTPGGSPTASGVPTPTPTSTAVCGNGILEGDEQCDKNAIDNSSCFEDVCTCDDFCTCDADVCTGTLSCNADCTLNFSRCVGDCAF